MGAPLAQEPQSVPVSWFRSTAGIEVPVPASGPGARGGAGLPAAASAPPLPAGSARAPASLPAPAPPRRVARFIAAEAAQSGLKLAEDGKLPELRLKEPGQADVKEAGSRGVSPILLFGTLGVSVLVSVVLVLMPTEPGNPGSALEKRQARQQIEENYIAGMDKEATLEPYQICLREALLAQSRRDVREERRMYRKVLDMLRAERGKFDKHLTGSRKRDEDLEQLITTLLSE